MLAVPTVGDVCVQQDLVVALMQSLAGLEEFGYSYRSVLVVCVQCEGSRSCLLSHFDREKGFDILHLLVEGFERRGEWRLEL